MVKITYDRNDIKDVEEIYHLSRMFHYLVLLNFSKMIDVDDCIKKALYHEKQLKQLKQLEL